MIYYICKWERDKPLNKKLKYKIRKRVDLL